MESAKERMIKLIKEARLRNKPKERDLDLDFQIIRYFLAGLVFWHLVFCMFN